MKQDSKNKLSQMLELIQKSSSWVKDKLLKKTTAVAPIDLVPEEVVVDEDRAFSTSIVFPQAEVGGMLYRPMTLVIMNHQCIGDLPELGHGHDGGHNDKHDHPIPNIHPNNLILLLWNM